MSINEVRYLPECGSTNAYVKEHFEEFGPVGAVYTAVSYTHLDVYKRQPLRCCLRSRSRCSRAPAVSAGR